MTKQEYHDAISKAIAMGKACGVCQTSIGHELNKIKDEYISSLEAENAKLYAEIGKLKGEANETNQ